MVQHSARSTMRILHYYYIGKQGIRPDEQRQLHPLFFNNKMSSEI
jgi:hypothetical protein